MMSRTNRDFSKHKLEIKKMDGVTIHDLYLPGTSSFRVVFINAYGSLWITGDYYQWFAQCEFHPENEQSVDDHYWAGKIKDSMVFSPEATKAELQNKIETIQEHLNDEESLADGWYDEDEEHTLLKFYQDCIENVGRDGEEYKQYAAAHLLEDLTGSETIIYETELDYSLRFIFDAFEEIIRRVRIQNQDKKEVPGSSKPVIDLNKQFEQYLQLVGLADSKLPTDFIRETKRAFYGACGQMLVLMRAIENANLAPSKVTAQKMILSHQVQNFWDAEQKKQLNTLSDEKTKN